MEWTFVGKHRVHCAKIRSISFGVSKNEFGEEYLRLFSISDDMRMAEFEIKKVDYEKAKK